MGDGEKLLTYLNSALKVLLGLDIFPRVPKKKLNFVGQCNCGYVYNGDVNVGFFFSTLKHLEQVKHLFEKLIILVSILLAYL